MSSTSPPAPPPAADLPLQPLSLMARHRPMDPALRWQDDGTWLTLSWSQLAQQVLRAAQGWRALGVAPGDGVLVLGDDEAGVGEAPVVSLLALISLGAHVRASSPEHLHRALPGVRFALARGTQEVDRLLAHPPGGLLAIVVENEFGTEPSPLVRVLGWHGLLQGTPGGEALPVPSQDHLALVGQSPDGAPCEWTVASLKGPTACPAARRALADFDIGWVPGVRWLLNDWLATGALLVLSPAGAAAASLAAAGPCSLWLASGPAVARWARRVQQRAGRRGAGAWALRGRQAAWPLEQVAQGLRTRIRQVLGASPGLAVHTDAGAGAQAQHLIEMLGLTLSLAPDAAPALPTASVHHLRPPARIDRLEPLMTQVST